MGTSSRRGVRRMRGGGYSSGGGACPPGVFCLSNETILFILIVVVAAAIFIMWASRTSPAPAPAPAIIQHQPQQPPTIVNVKGGDDRYSMAPKPERVWYNGPDRDLLAPPIPIGFATRGLPEQYQVMGVLKGEDGEMKPLYGRRTGSSRDRYNYYTRTDTYNPVPLPLHYKRRDCQDDTGCEELMDGDELKIGPTGEKVKATMYRVNSYFL